MPAGLREDIDLDISAALRDVDKLEAALTQTAKQFKVELAKAADVLRGPGGTIKAKVDVDDHGTAKKVAADVNKIGDEAKGAEAASKKLGSSFDGVRTAVAGALAALGTRFVVGQIGEMIGAASDLAESQSKVDVVFGESAVQISEWGETSATAVGLAKQQALEAAGTFGNLFTALGLSQGAAAKLSPEVVQLGADFASFNNLEVPETLEKLRSGLVGEVEPLRSLGISFNAAQVEAKAMELGLADANGEISEGAKVQARWALIVEQSTAAQGDFARTSDGLANQQRILSAEIGERLLPVMLKAVQFGRGFLDFFLDLPEPVQNAVLGLAAMSIALGPLLVGVGNVSRAATGVSTAIKTLSVALGTSTAVVGAWAAVLLAVGVAYVGYTRLVSTVRDAQASFDAELSDNTNNLALAAGAVDKHTASTKGWSAAHKEAATSLFLTDKTAQQLDEDLKALEESGDAMNKKIATASKVLDDLSESTGVSRERLVQLANDMRINLGAATDEQKKKIADAAAAISGAVNPTERLADTQEVLGNQFATSTEQIDAFSDALDAALGVYLSSEEATIRVRQRVDELAKAFKDGRKDGETMQQFQDRLTLSTHDVTDAVTKEVKALVEDGTVSADAASQKEAITSRLLALADTLGGPMAKELREHAFRVGAIPDEKITNIDADTSKVDTKLSGLAALASLRGVEVAAAFAAGIVLGFRNEDGRITASADAIAGSIERAANRRLGIRSPSRVGIEIGGHFVEGITIGVEREGILAQQAADALAAGVGDVVYRAAQISVTEGQRIFAALDSVREAQARLTWIEADARSTSEQLARARLDLAAAQQEVNDATFDGRDASDELTTALDAQQRAASRLQESLDGALVALDAMNGLRSAQNGVRRAEQELWEAAERRNELPGEIAKAERDLAKARQEGKAVTASEALAITRARLAVTRAEQDWAAAQADTTLTVDERTEAEQQLAVARENLTRAEADSTAVTGNVEAAERRLAELRKEQTEIVDRVRDANERLQSAQLAVVDAQRQLIAAGEELTGGEAAAIRYFETIARQAGLSESAIRSLVSSMREATDLADDGAVTITPSPTTPNTTPGTPGTPGRRPPPGTVSVRTKGGTFDLPVGAIVTQDGKRYVVDDDGSLDLLTGNARAVTALTAGTTTTVRASTAASALARVTNLNVFPKTAVYDGKQTLGTLRIAELLSR